MRYPPSCLLPMALSLLMTQITHPSYLLRKDIDDDFLKLAGDRLSNRALMTDRMEYLMEESLPVHLSLELGVDPDYVLVSITFSMR